MDMTTRDIQAGMKVSGSAGKPLGTVARVFWKPAQGDHLVETAYSRGVPADQVENVDVFDQTSQGTRHGLPPTSEISYFEVDRGGILGMGAKHLYIPVAAVRKVEASHNQITLACTARQAAERYQHQPTGAPAESR